VKRSEVKFLLVLSYFRPWAEIPLKAVTTKKSIITKNLANVNNKSTMFFFGKLLYVSLLYTP